jgi:hypothetical protein
MKEVGFYPVEAAGALLASIPAKMAIFCRFLLDAELCSPKHHAQNPGEIQQTAHKKRSRRQQ